MTQDRGLVAQEPTLVAQEPAAQPHDPGPQEPEAPDAEAGMATVEYAIVTLPAAATVAQDRGGAGIATRSSPSATRPDACVRCSERALIAQATAARRPLDDQPAPSGHTHYSHCDRTAMWRWAALCADGTVRCGSAVASAVGR